MDLGLVAMRVYSTITGASELHHQIQFSVILRSPLFGGEGHPDTPDAVSIYIYIYIYICIYMCVCVRVCVCVCTVKEISVRRPIKLLIIFFIPAKIPLKICVWYQDPMDISIPIRFYNFLPKKVINKTSFLRVEIIIRQFWKNVYLAYIRMSVENKCMRRL